MQISTRVLYCVDYFYITVQVDLQLNLASRTNWNQLNQII